MEENYELTAKLQYKKIAGFDIGIYNDGPVGILVSGGADSALLLYVLMKECTGTIHIYTNINTGVVKEQGPAFDNVVATCSSLTGNTNFVLHKNVLDNDTSLDYFNMCNDAINSQEVDIMYTGMTKFPAFEVWAQTWPRTSNFQENYEQRAPNRYIPLWGMTMSDDPRCSAGNRLYKPWANLNKQDIAAMYRELGVEAEIYPITRSCENDRYLVKHCGDCWWCYERVWGFGYLE